MKLSGIWAIPLLLSFTGCNNAMQAQSPILSAASAPIAPESEQVLNQLHTSAQTMPQAASQTSSQTISQAAQTVTQIHNQTSSQTNTHTNPPSALRQDYATTAPLPSTGRVTIRDDIRNLETKRLIATCPPDSAPYAFAESTNYQVQICSQEYDPWLPKYYIGQAKDGSGEMRITSTNPDEARQLIFKHQGYTYILHRDTDHPESSNAYLQVFTPDGNGYAEALLYLYEMGRMPRS